MNVLLLTATAHTAAHTNAGHFTWDNAATVIAGIGAALIAALVAVAGYTIQQRAARREQRARTYAEALQAVEDYLEGPYRIRRRDGSAEARRHLTESISTIKSRINFHQAWLRIHGSPAVADAYDAYVLAAQREAGPQMTAAWQGRPTRKDRDVPLGRPFDRGSSDGARATVTTAMKKDLDGQRPRLQRRTR
jgi:ketosteroid isomerase-like protein